MKRALGLAAAAALACAPLAADYKQAVAYYMQGRYDRAIQELKPDLDQNPEWEFGHRLAGLSYLKLKNNALAIASLSRAVALKSKAFSTYLGSSARLTSTCSATRTPSRLSTRASP